MKNNLFTLILLSFLLLNCGKSDPRRPDADRIIDTIPVRILELKTSTAGMSIECSGQFTTDDETYLAFKTGGIIERILVREGDAVRSGQLLARLDPTEIKAQAGQAQLAFDKARRDFLRAENLFRDSVATQEQYENARTAMEFAEHQLTAASFNRSYSEIRALQNGFILKKMANEGQVIAPGIPVLATNGAGRKLWLLRVGVSDREWTAIRIGDSASILCDAIPDRSFEGIVSNKSAGADAIGGALTVDLRITDPEGLASGLFGNAVIKTAKHEPYWEIPYEALLDGHAKSGYVFITEDRKTAQKVSVMVERMGKDHLTIRSGLEGFRYLVVSGSPYLKDGSPISIIK